MAFVRRQLRGFAQDYTDVAQAEYYTPTAEDLSTYTGSTTPTIITPEQISVGGGGVPQAVVSGGGGGGGGSWLTSLLGTALTGAAQVGSAFIASQKPATTTMINPLTGQPYYAAAGVAAPSTSILSSMGSLPIIAIIGIGAFLVLKGRKKGKK